VDADLLPSHCYEPVALALRNSIYQFPAPAPARMNLRCIRGTKHPLTSGHPLLLLRQDPESSEDSTAGRIGSGTQHAIGDYFREPALIPAIMQSCAETEWPFARHSR